jgi:NAD(P)H dehydrogenase (quinone)
MSKKIFILVGHPNKDSLNAFFASQYEKAAREAGFEVRRTNIWDMRFDPVLHHGYREIQALEPDLVKVQEDVKWAEHVVVFYPNWFITMPGVLKGLFDRCWLPGFAYHFRKNGLGWEKLLKGRTGRVFVTMDSQPFLEYLLMGDFTNEIKRGILGFAGIKTKVSKIGPMKNITEERKSRWVDYFHWAGTKGK